MRFSHSAFVFLLPIASFLVGCAPGDNDVTSEEILDLPLHPSAGGMPYEPPTGRNGLLPEQFWSDFAQASMRELQNFSLDSGASVVIGTKIVPVLPTPLHTNALLATYPDVMKHLVQCALKPTQAVYDPVNGRVYKGWWSLSFNSLSGTDWLTNPAGISTDVEAQAWVTECMIARLNNLGVHVDILLEGATPPIEVSSVYDGVYNYDESTVYANMFSSTLPISSNHPAFYAYVCREDNLADPKTGMCPSDGGKNWIDKRLCDNAPATCGLIDVGRCPTAGAACVADGQHWKCREYDVSASAFFGPNYAQTVGVELLTPITSTECDN